MREDHKLQSAVIARLDLDPSIDSSHLGVAARSGVVTLSGHVPSLRERTAAERAAGSMRGVKAVVNQITVEIDGQAMTSDELLAEQAYARLSSNATVPKNRLFLAIKDGVVTVHGDVDWPFQLQAALGDLEHLAGVREVRTDAMVRPPVSPERVHERIRQTLEYLSPIDAERITVLVDGSEVELSGDVTSWHEKDLAESAAWCIPGVSKVTNRISVL
jgi:osmotically-inducible protein OsmY